MRTLGLILAGLVGGSSWGQSIKLPAVTRATLGNGMRIVLMEYRRAPVLSVRLLFRGGSSLDSAGKAGASDLMADMLTQGTESMSAPDFAEQVDFLGASLSASAEPDAVTVSLDLLARDAEAGLDILRDVVRKPAFAAEELERRRRLILAGLQTVVEDPSSVADWVAHDLVFAGHVYGSVPRVSTVTGLSREDVLDFYKRQVTPANAILVAVGDFKSSSMLAGLRARFGSWGAGGAMALQQQKQRTTTPRIVVVDKPDATQAQIRFVRAGLPAGSPDQFAAEVASTAIGGSFTSRLIEEIRIAKGLTYDIASSFSPMRLGGSFTISTFTKVETTRALIDAARAVLRQAASKGLTAEELQRAKAFKAGSFARSSQTPEALARRLAAIELYGLPADYLQKYLSRISAVTLVEANRALRRYFDPGRLAMVVVGPLAAIRPQLKGLGKLEERPLEGIAR